MSWPILYYRVRARYSIPFIVLWYLYQSSRRRPNVIPVALLKQYFSLTFFALACYLVLPFPYGHYSAGSPFANMFAFRVNAAIWRSVEFLAMFMIVQISLATGKFRELKFCTIAAIFPLVWAGVASLYGGAYIAAHGGSARILTALSQEGERSFEYMEMADKAASLGMGGSEGVYLSAFIIPLQLVSIAYVKGWKKWAFAAAALLECIAIQYGGLQTPLLITVAGIILAFISKKDKGCWVLGCGIIMALGMIWFSFNPRIFASFSGPLRKIGYYTEESFPQMSERFLSTADSVEGDKDSYAYMRSQLQQRSAKEFVKGNILVGRLFKRGPGGGGHSELLDCLACYGLLGVFVIGLFWYAYLKYCNELAKVSLGRKWLALPYIYAGAWIFSSVPNPARLGAPTMILVVPGLAVFFTDFERRWGIR